MNKVCKEYISDAKKFFPIMGKKERDYLRKVSGDIEDFIETEKITTKAELIEKYHQPYEVANNYYATFFDTKLIVKRIKISKYIKIFISVLITIILIGFSFYMFAWNVSLNTGIREEMVGIDQITLNGDKEKEHDIDKGDNYDSMIESENEEIIEEDEIIE